MLRTGFVFNYQEDYIILAIGHQPYSGLRVPLTFEQIKISAIVLAGVVIAIPLSVESFFQLRNR